MATSTSGQAAQDLPSERNTLQKVELSKKPITMDKRVSTKLQTLQSNIKSAKSRLTKAKEQLNNLVEKKAAWRITT